MKNLLISVVLLFCVVAVSPGADLLDMIPRPKASIENCDIDSISFRDINLLFDIGITNPYPVIMKLEAVRFRFLIEKKQLFETSTKKGFKILPRKKATNQFLVNLKYLDIEKIVRNYLDRDYLDCDIEGDIVLKLPRTGIQGVPETWTIPYRLKKRVPAIKPEISVKNFNVQKPSMEELTRAIKTSGKKLNAETAMGVFDDILAGRKPTDKTVKPDDLDVKLTVSFDIELLNKTKAKVLFQALNYEYFVNSEKLINGETKDIKNAGNKSVLRIQNQFSSRQLGKGILNAFNNRKGDFTLKGHTFLKMPESIKKEPLKLVFDEKGAFSF
jgi:hypothetical protein